MSKAAERLFVTQPAVSMQMKQLEEQIGLPLVEQIGRRICLTEAGQLLRVHARTKGALFRTLDILPEYIDIV